jgi:hypothetical protein
VKRHAFHLHINDLALDQLTAHARAVVVVVSFVFPARC